VGGRGKGLLLSNQNSKKTIERRAERRIFSSEKGRLSLVGGEGVVKEIVGPLLGKRDESMRKSNRVQGKRGDEKPPGLKNNSMERFPSKKIGPEGDSKLLVLGKGVLQRKSKRSYATEKEKALHVY